MCTPTDSISKEQRQHWEEQEAVLDRPAAVGCVALDADGTVVAGTSTGGIALRTNGDG